MSFAIHPELEDFLTKFVKGAAGISERICAGGSLIIHQFDVSGASLAHCSIYFETNASNSCLDAQIVSFSCNVGVSSQLRRYSFPSFVS